MPVIACPNVRIGLRQYQLQEPVGIEVRRARNRSVRWPIQRFPDGPQSGSRSCDVSASPLRSRKAGFPRSGSDLGLPSWACPDSRRGLSTDIRTPHPRWSTHDLVPTSKAGLSRLRVREPPWDRQVPRAPSLHAGVTVMHKTSCVSSQNITSTSSLLRAHAPNRCPAVASGIASLLLASCGRSLQVAASPCCAPVLPDAISADPSVRVWTPTPVAPRVHFPFLPLGHWPSPRLNRVGA